MALQILENNGIFHLKGTLNSTTSRSFIIHFEHLIQRFKNVTVNIEKVIEIDANGVTAFKTLYANALRNHKMFSVTGNGCKDLYEEFLNKHIA